MISKLLPYMVFMGEICDRKVLHNVAYLPILLFDPLYVKFILKIKNFLKTRYILEKPEKVVILWI
jgi:hypothetical protein